MGCLLFLLLWALLQAWGSAEVPQRLFPFRCLQISSFANSNWTRTDGLAWLGELQTHSWSNDSDTIRSLKPWSQGTFSDQQWEALQRVFRVYRSSFTRDVKEFAKMLRLSYPVELQVSAGCEVHPGNASHNFFHVAFQGRDILSFQGTSWEPAQEAPLWVNLAIQVLNQDKWTRETVQWLLNDTCPQFVSGLLESGKSELEKQVKPKAWLSRGPSPGPGRLQLVCHVSGFYPKPVWVKWMRGEQEQQGTQRGDILPNADETWYLRATLEVAAGEAAGLSCRVKHSSLEGQDIVLYWAGGSHISVGLIALAVLACLLFLLALIVGFTFRFKRQSSYQGIL
ncbi:antigen-presenting glycoprotein CD1d isoform X1 [Papio anubis]|uniref:Ig-like domain-containing protein n=1 Tax=Papio anubis TaxID=9555 RepID=A0A096MZ34_PAPAN|nr:antigen-presenting glycoprotein CD1d isoform X1 [Papio anubis]XP_017803694.1 antigen-presenting glycoprotein CD1d isoform X1 [Papio anubis]